MTKIALILVNWKNLKDTLECLASLKNLDYPHHEIIVVDNHSKDGSFEALQQRHPEITLIETEENLGFAGGNNVGIRLALQRQADFIFLLNNDTTVSPNLLSAFLQAAKKKPRGGIFGAKVFKYYEKSTLDHFGGMWDKTRAEFQIVGNGEKDSPAFQEMRRVDYVCGCAFFIRKEVIEQLGLLEEKFFLLWEETDYCYRAKKAGFEVWSVPEAKIWHKVSASFSGAVHSQYYWWRNRLLWIERNLSPQEKKEVYGRVIFPEIRHLIKLHLLKSMQLLFLFPFFLLSSQAKRRYKLLRYKASLKGIEHYLFKKFGKGPDWIAKKSKKISSLIANSSPEKK